MSDSDKNLHLSPLLDKIRDYGPGEEPESESADAAEQPTETPPEPARDETPATEAADTSGEAAPEPPSAPLATTPAPAKSSKVAVYSLVVLWLLTLAGGFGAFVWQQTRIDALVVDLRSERGKGNDLVAAAEREATRLADRVAELDNTIVELRAALADAQSEAAALAIASVGAVEPAEPEPEIIEAAPVAAPEQPITATPTEPEPPVAEAPVVEQEPPAAPAPVEPAPTGSWYINLSTLSSEAAARQWLDALADAPARAEIVAVESGGMTLYRVRVGGYTSRDEAMGAANDLGVSGAWASKG